MNATGSYGLEILAFESTCVHVLFRLALEQATSPEFPRRACLTKFSSQGYQLRFMYWYTPSDYWADIAFSEQLNLAIMEDFEQAGIQQALPRRPASTNSTGKVR